MSFAVPWNRETMTLHNHQEHELDRIMKVLQMHEAMTLAVAEARHTEHLWHQGWAAGIRHAASLPYTDLQEFAASLGPEPEL
jgi:hypothetical protein